MNKITDIFKTSIFETSIENDNYINYFKKILRDEQSKNYCIKKSNNGGFQTIDFKEVNSKEILIDIFLTPVSNYIKTFKLKKKLDLYLENYWINSNLLNDNNDLHSHSLSNISGVYYIEVPDNSGRLVFQHGDLSKITNTNKNFEYIDDANFFSKYYIIPKKYDLILFPSDTFHYVEQNRSNKERISVAFNITFK
jgi:uncharacterized protein (TIGR02466 family)